MQAHLARSFKGVNGSADAAAKALEQAWPLVLGDPLLHGETAISVSLFGSAGTPLVKEHHGSLTKALGMQLRKWCVLQAKAAAMKPSDVPGKPSNLRVRLSAPELTLGNDLKVDYKDSASPLVGSELARTSITSTGNGSGSTTDPVVAWNPNLNFYNDYRGYMNTKITKERTPRRLPGPGLRHDAAGSPISTKASFAIQDGVTELQAH